MSTLPTTENKRGVLALVVAHCAGMIDLIGLPVWVGSLISQYKFDPQQAGGLVTLFLIGASVASLFFAPRFTRTNQKVAAVSGFFIATVAFALSSHNTAFPILAVLHFIGGLSAGTALASRTARLAMRRIHIALLLMLVWRLVSSELSFLAQRRTLSRSLAAHRCSTPSW